MKYKLGHMQPVDTFYPACDDGFLKLYIKEAFYVVYKYLSAPPIRWQLIMYSGCVCVQSVFGSKISEKVIDGFCKSYSRHSWKWLTFGTDHS